MTLRGFIDIVVEQLSPLYSQQECKVIAVRLLKEYIVGYKGYEHMVEPLSEVDNSFEEGLMGAVGRLSLGEPLQYVIGYEMFCGHRFNVAPGVLVPRPETEELVKEVVSRAGRINGCRVLDVCTGSGCIGLSVAAQVPDVKVSACDISSAALDIARAQQIYACDAAGGKVEVNFFECDILSNDAYEVIGQSCGCDGFDIVVSNPPYICECERPLMHKNVLDYEPSLALFVPDDDPLRFYRRIGELSGGLLRQGGVLLFEINERFGSETVEMLYGMGYVGCEVKQDLFGKDRMVVALK